MKTKGQRGNIVQDNQEAKTSNPTLHLRDGRVVENTGKVQKHDSQQVNVWDERVVKRDTTQFILHLKNKYMKLKPKELRSFWLAYDLLEKLTVRFPELTDVMLLINDGRDHDNHSPAWRMANEFEGYFSKCPAIRIDRAVLATGSGSVMVDLILRGAAQNSSALVASPLVSQGKLK
jgi:hypothetical protein